MRIAMLSWETLHSIAVGGVAPHVTELSAALVRRGHEVHVFTRRAAGQRTHEQIDGVHYHRYFYPGHPDFIDDVNNMCRTFTDELFEIEDLVGHFDVVHAHDWLTANAMIWIKKGRGHKGILTIHSTEYARCGNVMHNGRSARIRDQECAGAYWADRVIAVSHATRAEMASMYKVPDDKMRTVYNGVSPNRFEGEIDQGAVKRGYAIGPVDPTVLFCGRLEHQKGPDLLVEAVPSILRTQPRAKVVFAGEGTLRRQLEGRARQLGVGDACRFLGYRNGQELVTLFKMADAVCVPSRNEPFGIVVLEGWAAGKPVVVTQSGGPNEYVTHEETGLKIYPTVDSVAWGVNSLFSDFDRARRLGESGRRAVEDRFSWDHIAGQTLAVYDPSAVCVAKPAPEPVAEPAREVVAVRTPAPVPVVAKLIVKVAGGGQVLSDALTSCMLVLAEAGLSPQIRDAVITVAGEWGAVSDAIRACYQTFNGDGIVRIVTSLHHAPYGATEEDGEDQLGLRPPAGERHWPTGRTRPRKEPVKTLSVA
jgi:glycogen synthase